MLFVAACVDTSAPGAALPGGAGAVDNPSSGVGAMTGSVPRTSADCSGYPATGGAFELGAQLDLDPVPVPAAEIDDRAPYRWDNVTIMGGGFVSGIVFSTPPPT